MFEKALIINFRPMLLDVSLVAQSIYLYSAIVAWAGSVVIFLLSLKFCLRRAPAPYMKVLPLYFFISTMTEIIGYIFTLIKVDNFFVYWAFGVFEVTYLLHFFSKLIPFFPKKLIVAGALLVFIPSATAFIVTTRVRTGFFFAAVLDTITVLVPCVLYFKRVISIPNPVPLEKDPGFWMTTGIFFYFSIRLPVFICTICFLYARAPYLSLAIYSIQNIALVLTFILYTKAMSCRKIPIS